MIKKILFGLLGLIVLLVIVGFLLPGQLEVSRSIVVNAPAEYAFEEVNGLENWNKWSYWNQLDTTMAITYGEKRQGAGAFYSWASSEMGNGKLSITESVPFKSIKADLDFMENGTAKAWYDFEPEGEGTKVTMNFSSDFGMNPIARWFSVLVMKGEMDHAFEHNLNKIKELSEAKPKFSIAMSREEVPAISYIGLSGKMNPQDMNAVVNQMGKMYEELYGALKKSKVEPKGAAFALFPSFTPESMEFVCAVPVEATAKIPAKYKVMQTQAGEVVKASHTGSYEKLEDLHNQLNQFIEFRNLEIAGAPWEVYVKGPMEEKDPANYVTEVYYPVKAK